MFRSQLLVAVAVLVALLVSVIGIEEKRLESQRSKTSIAAVALSNAVAERDSTREISGLSSGLAKVLGDSLRLVEKRVVQRNQRADAVDAELGRTRLAHYIMKGAVDSLRRIGVARVVEDSARSVRRVHFDMRKAPYTVAADFEMPYPPDSLARASLSIALDPIRVDARVHCSKPDSLGVRIATVVASAPKWTSIQFDRVEQAAELCGPPAARVAVARAIRLSPMMIGVGRVMGVRAAPAWGVFVGVGFSLGS